MIGVAHTTAHTTLDPPDVHADSALSPRLIDLPGHVGSGRVDRLSTSVVSGAVRPVASGLREQPRQPEAHTTAHTGRLVCARGVL